MKQIGTKELFRYWAQVRRGTNSERLDIDPVAVHSSLRDAFILQLDCEIKFAIELSGAQFNALWLRDVRGDSFVELWRLSDRRVIQELMRDTVNETMPVVAGVRAWPAVLDLGSVDFELLLLPLQLLGRTNTRILGTLSPANARKWLGFAPAEQLELLSFRTLRPEDETILRNSKLFRRPPTAPRPKLVVHEGGKQIRQ